MATRPVLTLQQKQRLTLTPQLRQALQMLQCSGQELENELARMLADNPWLERVEPGQEAGDSHGLPDEASSGEPVLVETLGEYPAEPLDDRQPSAGEYEPNDSAAPPLSLRAHLLEQLRLMRMSDRQRVLVMLLIDELDDNGYLPSSLDEIAASMPESMQAEMAEWQGALVHLQSMEPSGVGARSLAECLLLQLALQESIAAEVRACASLLAVDHLESLAAGRLHKLGPALGYSTEVLSQAHQLLLRLDPKPGRAWTQTAAPWVVPEVLVSKTAQGWQAFLNPSAVPKLRLCQPGGDLHRGDAAALKQRQQAQGMLQQIQSRFDTVLSVARFLVQHQQAYFEQGARVMRPLVLREVAQALDVHVSTISRATRQKYAQTPWGVVELKYFFASAVAEGSQAEVSGTAVQALIKEWIDAESDSRPLSDSQIAQRLLRQGIRVARRTVAKYREAAGIANACRRKAAAGRGGRLAG